MNEIRRQAFLLDLQAAAALTPEETKALLDEMQNMKG